MSNDGWLISGQTTTVGVACEFASASGANLPYGGSRELVLNGYMVQVASSLANSSVMATLRRGDSSGAALSSTPIMLDTAEGIVSVSGLNINAKYFAIAAGTTHANAMLGTMWGVYG